MIVQFVSAPEMVTVPVGGVAPPVTDTVTLTDCPADDGFGVLAVMVVIVGGNATVWPTDPLLPVCVASPLYVAVRVFPPAELKVTTQLPVPFVRVKEQFVSAPVISTVPVGNVIPATVTLTVTDCPILDGSGLCAVMVVMDSVGRITLWSSVSVLPACSAAPLYVAVIDLVPFVVKVKLQLPVPPASVTVQLVPGPEMSTVPVGLGHVLVTVTVTLTA